MQEKVIYIDDIEYNVTASVMITSEFSYKELF